MNRMKRLIIFALFVGLSCYASGIRDYMTKFLSDELRSAMSKQDKMKIKYTKAEIESFIQCHTKCTVGGLSNTEWEIFKRGYQKGKNPEYRAVAETFFFVSQGCSLACKQTTLEKDEYN